MFEKRKFLVIIAFLVFCVLLLPGVVSAAEPDVVYVNTTGNDSNPGTQESPKLTILNATGTVASGGVVFIGKGIYKGNGNRNLTINKEMLIVGENQQNTIIDAEGLSRIFNINSTNVTFMNLTLRNGDSSDGSGGAIYISSGNFLTVINSTFTNNNGASGGAIYNYGRLNVIGSTFTNNNANINGGAIYNEVGTTPDDVLLFVENSTFKGNTVTSAGSFVRGGAIASYGPCIVIYSIFTNNSVSDTYGIGGAIFNGGKLAVAFSDFKQNSAREGGAIWNLIDIVTVNNSTFTDNKANFGGGAIYNEGDLFVEDSTFTGNSANGGGAINNYAKILSVNNSIFKNNFAISNGGAIYNFDGIVTVNFNSIVGNTASKGSAIYSNAGYTGSVNAENNWWGSNANPSSLIYGNVDFDPWLKSPTVISTDPKNNTVSVPVNKVIKITFDQDIKMGSGWVELKKGSTVIKTDNSISGNVLTLKPFTSLSPGDYVVVIHAGSVTQEIGIPVALFSTKFKVAATSKATISQILAAAATVKSYYENNKKLPGTVDINGIKVSMPQFLYLLSQATVQINSGNTESITIKNVNSAPKESGQIKSGKILKADFVTIAKNAVNFINSNGRAPNYLTTKLGNMQFTKAVYMFSTVLSFYKTNKRLPNYVTMSK